MRGAKRFRTPQAEVEQECETCRDCPPRDMGAEVPNFYGAVDGEALQGYYYQNFVCPWHEHHAEAQTIMEWEWQGIEFDGLSSAACHLYEAKRGYDGFLQDDWVGGAPRLRDWILNSKAKDPLLPARRQAGRHVRAVRPYHPTVRLSWVFSEQITKVHMQAFFNESGFYEIETELRTWGGT